MTVIAPPSEASPFAMIESRLLAAILAAPPAFRFAVGPISVDVHAAEPGMAARALPVLEHALVEAPRDMHIRVAMVDTSAIGEPPPPTLPGAESLLAPDDEVNLREGPRIAAIHQAQSRTWETFDSTRGLGLILTADASCIAPWEWAAPFKRMIAWASAGRPYGLLHGAVLARDGHGVMLAGGSGVGKSTTTAAAILRGLRTVGDDVALIEWREPGNILAHAAYDSLKVGEGSLALLGGRIAAAGEAVGPGIAKHLLRISDVTPGALTSTVRLRAVLLPRLAHATVSSLRPAPPGALLRALGPHSAYVMRVTPEASFALAARLARSMPCRVLDLSSDPLEAAAFLERVLDDIIAGREP